MKGYKQTTKEQEDSILQIYDKTKSTRITADQLGLNIQRVHACLKRHGIKTKSYKANACYRNFDLVVRLAKEGQSLSEIGRQVGTNRRQVKEFLELYDIDYAGHIQRGQNNPHWKGGEMIDKDGYVLVRLYKGHPSADRHGYIRKHRWIMEQHLGRRLLPTEIVHHIDGDKQNNSLDNLHLYSKNSDHLAETLKGHVPNWTPEGRQRILEGVRQPRGHKQKPTL